MKRKVCPLYIFFVTTKENPSSWGEKETIYRVGTGRGSNDTIMGQRKTMGGYAND